MHFKAVCFSSTVSKTFICVFKHQDSVLQSPNLLLAKPVSSNHLGNTSMFL